MNVTLVRHATLLLDTSHGRILVDPMLRAAGTTPPIENTPNQRRNPLVELPTTASEVVDGVELCIVTHLHSDHFDDAADEVLPRDVPILTQPESADALAARGFTNISVEHPSIPMTRGRHGTGQIGEAMGAVSGWVVDDLYIAGDTIWCDEVREALERHRPRAVVLNGSGAHFDLGGPIVMDVEDVRQVRAATDASIAVVHLEAINHCVQPRSAYREIAGVHVPADGETLRL
jgi:L-ascorbate metabolism protein UlaG (beta-lactamase superfamily)